MGEVIMEVLSETRQEDEAVGAAAFRGKTCPLTVALKGWSM